jgi:hypothetical protein
MDALVEALEHDPVKLAPAFDAGCGPAFVRDKRDNTLRGDHARTKIDSAMMIHFEHIAL